MVLVDSAPCEPEKELLSQKAVISLPPVPTQTEIFDQFEAACEEHP